MDLEPELGVDSRFSFYFDNNGTQIRCGSAAEDGSDTTHFTAAWPYSSGVWKHLVLSYSETATELYIDGVLRASGSGVSSAVQGMKRLWFGRNRSGEKLLFGMIDEVKTWAYPLSSAEVMAEYQGYASIDSDGDGLSNLQEVASGTDVDLPDSDFDGVLDGMDAYPLDPSRWSSSPPGNPGDTTSPIINLLYPSSAVLQ
jgi:hypothetical protein